MLARRDSSQHQFFGHAIAADQLNHHIDAGIVDQLLRVAQHLHAIAHDAFGAGGV